MTTIGEIHRPDPAAEARQRARLERTKAARDEAAVDARARPRSAAAAATATT